MSEKNLNPTSMYNILYDTLQEAFLISKLGVQESLFKNNEITIVCTCAVRFEGTANEN